MSVEDQITQLIHELQTAIMNIQDKKKRIVELLTAITTLALNCPMDYLESLGVLDMAKDTVIAEMKFEADAHKFKALAEAYKYEEEETR